MCNATNCSHDLNDSLDDIFGDYEAGVPADLTLANAQQVKMHEEKCPSCKGSGVFRSYSGRVVGDCFKCKGKGTLFFRQSLEQREKAKVQRDARKEREQQSVAEQVAVWCSANPNEAAWLRDSSARGFEFAVSLLDALNKYGHLTERQEAAVRSATEKSLARQAQWAAERAERDANKADIDISRIDEAFTSAVKAGLKFPKLRLDDFTLSLASVNSRNAGSIYVKQDDLYLGKISDGKFTRSRDCDADIEARIVAACADPAAAAEAYGKRTGKCSCCGRELTNEESIARAIGPICASKWGW
jgi:uncharacterized Zn finger protein (UPF0148 family)